MKVWVTRQRTREAHPAALWGITPWESKAKWAAAGGFWGRQSSSGLPLVFTSLSDRHFPDSLRVGWGQAEWNKRGSSCWCILEASLTAAIGRSRPKGVRGSFRFRVFTIPNLPLRHWGPRTTLECSAYSRLLPVWRRRNSYPRRHRELYSVTRPSHWSSPRASEEEEPQPPGCWDPVVLGTRGVLCKLGENCMSSAQTQLG